MLMFAPRWQVFWGVSCEPHVRDPESRVEKRDQTATGKFFVTQGNPWDAKFVGCCRIPELRNAPGAEWSLEAPIDLIRSTGMPSLRSKDYFTLPNHCAADAAVPTPGPGIRVTGRLCKAAFYRYYVWQSDRQGRDSW